MSQSILNDYKRILPIGQFIKKISLFIESEKLKSKGLTSGKGLHAVPSHGSRQKDEEQGKDTTWTVLSETHPREN